MPCRMSVFSGRKRENPPRQNTKKCYFGGFSRGDLLPLCAPPFEDTTYIAGKDTTHNVACFRVEGLLVVMRKHSKVSICRVFSVAGFRVLDPPHDKSKFVVSRFRPENTLKRHGTNQPQKSPIVSFAFLP